MQKKSFTRACLFFGIIFLLSICIVSPSLAGAYQDSAHGHGTYGVDRDDLSGAGYSVGNCAHCHEQHASVTGSEPPPNSPAGPDNFALFAKNFNTTKTTGPYLESDNMCFYCHRGLGSSFQQVTNYDYARTFGGYTGSAVDNILDAFNQPSFSPPTYNPSYHNLYNIWYYYKNVSLTDFFLAESNPCNACHNPHRAKRNNSTPANPANTSISLPSDHENLWGDGTSPSERMSKYTDYQPPYFYDSTTTYEPDNTSSPDNDLKTPDYNSFCLECHQYSVPSPNTNSRHPTYKGTGYLAPITWGSGGDKHGETTADQSVCPDAPYPQTIGVGKILSCLDCHEPHGSPNPYLLREAVNGDNLADEYNDDDGLADPVYIVSYDGPASTTSSSDHRNNDIKYLCDRCHMDDAELGGLDTHSGGPAGPDYICEEDHYYILHHYVVSTTGIAYGDDAALKYSSCNNTDPPYAFTSCDKCHTTGYGGAPGTGFCGKQAVPYYQCIDCHYHGAQVGHLTGSGNKPPIPPPPDHSASDLPGGSSTTPIF